MITTTSTTTTRMPRTTRRISARPARGTRATQQLLAVAIAPSVALAPATPADEPTRLRVHIAWLSGQVEDVDANVASMTHTYSEMGEQSDWTDARLPQLDETISFWKNRYEALLSQLRDARARLMSLQAQASPATA